MTVTLKGILSTEMTSQSCPLCYEMDEGSGLGYQWSCCHEDSSEEDQRIDVPYGFETFLVLVIIIVVMAVIIINFLITCLIVFKRKNRKSIERLTEKNSEECDEATKMKPET